jgi:inorganic pyrophosphatase/exopolyphosphatase
VWVHYYFDKGLPINNILIACHNDKERAKWDKDLDMVEVIEIVDNHKVMLWH